jgi:hypothetical protein
MLMERPQRTLVRLDAAAVIRLFEAAYAEQTFWRKTKGISAREVGNVVTAPPRASWLRSVTTLCYNRHDFDGVARVAKRAVKQLPRDVHSWYNLGCAAEKLSRFEETVLRI